MKVKHLESALSSLQREFPSPNAALEQYPTSAHLAARVVAFAAENGDLGSGMTCLDLGCGTGMLTCAAGFFCDVVIAVDCDIEALRVAQENARSVELHATTHFIQAMVRICSNSRVANKGVTKRKGTLRGRGQRPSQRRTKEILIEGLGDGIPMKDNCVDTVISNPPFGTKMNEGIDAQFLRSATRLARKAVYSFHKSSTRPFLSKLVAEWGYKLEVAAEMKFDIPHSYTFHKQAIKDIEVDLLRVVI